MTQIKVELFSRKKKRFVDATMHDELSEENRTELERFNDKSVLSRLIPKSMRSPSDEWSWSRKIHRAEYFLGAKIWIVECDDALGAKQMKTQGVMICYPGKSQLDDKSIHMVAAMATAPHNRRVGLGYWWRASGYQGVGVHLLKQASNISMQMGFNGVVGLNALPKAETFYLKAGLDKHSGVTDKQGFAYFEGVP